MTYASYAQRLTEDRRLAVLRLLVRAPGYALNELVLARSLRDLGHNVSAATLSEDCAFLIGGRSALATLTRLDDGEQALNVLALTRHGEDVATGRERAPGIARPRPRQ